MAINSTPMAFVRFSVDTPSSEFWSTFDDAIRGAVFVTEEGASISSGLVTWDDSFKTDFSYACYNKGEYVAFQFRVDERKVPPIIKKQYVSKKVEEYKAANEGRFPSREIRKEISENADLVLLQRAFPVPSFCELIWNPRSQVLYAGSANTKMLERLVEFFESKFQLYPRIMSSVELGKRLFVGSEEYIARITAFEEDGSSTLLGHEFLTWLWYSLDSEIMTGISVREKPVAAGLLDRISLTLPGDNKEKVIVVTSDPNAVHEARLALFQGKSVDEIALAMTVGDSEYTVTLDRGIYSIKNVKPPKHDGTRTDDDEDGKFFEKMFFLEEVCDAIDAMYKEFLSKRLDLSEWEVLKNEQREWIERGINR